MIGRIALIVLSLSVAAAAQAKDAVLLPVELPGYNTPVYTEMMTGRLDQSLRKLTDVARVQVARPAELTAYRYAGNGRAPAPRMALQLCGAYQTDYVCWVSVRFQPAYDATSHSLALAGAARLWIYGKKQQAVVVDEPISLVRSAPCKDEMGIAKLAPRLAQECMDDLGVRIGGIARSQARPRQAGAPAPPPKASANYLKLVKLIESYRTFQKRGDAVSMNEVDRQISALYYKMSAPERDQVNQNYPDFARTPTPEGLGPAEWDWNLQRPTR